MTDKIAVLSTCGTIDEAERIAHSLIDKRLAACVNVLPGVSSIYRWKGAVEKSSELMLIIKTRRSLFEALSDELRQTHPYDVPEIVALPVEAGSASYLKWIEEETA